MEWFMNTLDGMPIILREGKDSDEKKKSQWKKVQSSRSTDTNLEAITV